MTAIVDLKLQGQMDHLRLAWQAGETLLSNVMFEADPEGSRYNILLCIQELLTNVLRHAYGGDVSQPIDVHLEASEGEFAVEIRDRGRRFDPVGHESPAARLEEDEPPSENGGYGLVIVKMVMDELQHEYVDGCNVVRARRRVQSFVPAESTGLGA